MIHFVVHQEDDGVGVSSLTAAKLLGHREFVPTRLHESARP